MKPGSRWPAAILAVLAAACSAYPEYIPVVPAPRQLQWRAAAQVQAFLVTPPARPHVDIGMLQAIAYDKTVEQMIALLRTTAGQHGCDALVVTSLHVSPRGLSTLASIDGSCEVYTDAPATATSP